MIKLMSLILIVSLLLGWIVNLCHVIAGFVSNEPVTTMFIGRIIGVPVVILGGVLGWF